MQTEETPIHQDALGHLQRTVELPRLIAVLDVWGVEWYSAMGFRGVGLRVARDCMGARTEAVSGLRALRLLACGVLLLGF